MHTQKKSKLSGGRVRAWAITLNGRFQWIERNSDYKGKDLLLYFCRNQASYEWGEWNDARKKSNRRWKLNKGVKLVPVEIRPVGKVKTVGK